MKTKTLLFGSRVVTFVGVCVLAVHLALPKAELALSHLAVAQEMTARKSVQQPVTASGEEAAAGRLLSAVLPARAPEGGPALGGQASAATVSVKQFGVKGDGQSDDYEALKTAAAYICSHPGQTLVFPPGVYKVAPFKVEGGPNKNNVTDIVYDGCRNVTISGKGAKIDVFGAFNRPGDYACAGKYKCSYTNQVAPFEFKNSSNFTLTGFELYGNADKATHDPGLTEGSSMGVVTYNCSNYTISNLHAHHFLTDGLYIGHDRKADRNATITGVTSTNNGRNGMSLIQVRGIQVSNSTFAHNARTDGQYGYYGPGAGIDVEPNAVPPVVDVESGEVVIQNCQFEDNRGWQFVCAHTDQVDSTDVKQCKIKVQSPDSSPLAFCAFPANGTVQECTFNLAKGHYVFLHGDRSKFPSLRQLIFENNILNLGWNGGILSAPTGESLNIQFKGNTVNVSGPPGDRSDMKLCNLAVVSGNTFSVDQRGYSGSAGGQNVILYEGTAEIEGNTYRTNLSGPGKAFKIDYPPQARVARETYSPNFSK